MAIKPKSGLSRPTVGPASNQIPSEVPKPPGARGRDTLIEPRSGTPRGTGARPSKRSRGAGLKPSAKRGRTNY